MVEFKCNTIGVDIRMKKELDNLDSIIIQNFAIVDMLFALYKNNFIESDYFNDLPFIQPFCKDILKQVNLNNSSVLLLMLFLLLNHINELKDEESEKRIIYISEYIRTHMESLYFDGETLDAKFNFCSFVRNSISHMNTKFKEESGRLKVYFKSDIYVLIPNFKKKQKRTIKFSLDIDDVSILINLLYELVAQYIIKLQQ